MYRAYRIDSGTTTTKWMGAFSSPIWIRLNDNGEIIECAEKDATGVRLIGCFTNSWDGVYSLNESEQTEALQEIDDYKGEVVMTNIGTGTAEVITEATFSSRSMLDSMLAGTDRIPITDISARSSGYVTLGNLSSFVRSQLGGELAPYVLVQVTEGWANICEVVAIKDGMTIIAGEPYLHNNYQEWYISLPSYGQWTLKATCVDGNILAHRVTLDNISRTGTWHFGNSDFLPEMGRDGGLNAYTWDEINKISESGLASTYFNVGDTHEVTLRGTVGTLSLDTTLYAYILDFDHDKSYVGGPSNGITFGSFKSAISNGKDIALVDNKYGTYSWDGTKYFNMNHWNSARNYGGWKGCDLRYDILGSTDQAPSGYGDTPIEGRTGYDASSTTATNPVPNTLMAALPADLRAVMKPMCIYSDNYGGGSNSPSVVTPSIDYLPLLDEYEVFGVAKNAIAYVANKQKRYAYYANGNSVIKYCHNNLTSAVTWFERSPTYSYYHSFCSVNGGISSAVSDNSYGVAPIFKV